MLPDTSARAILKLAGVFNEAGGIDENFKTPGFGNKGMFTLFVSSCAKPGQSKNELRCMVMNLIGNTPYWHKLTGDTAGNIGDAENKTADSFIKLISDATQQYQQDAVHGVAVVESAKAI